MNLAMTDFDFYKREFEKPFVSREVDDPELVSCINDRRARAGLETSFGYKIVRRHGKLQWYWLMGVDSYGYLNPNISTVVCFDGFVLMNDTFKRVMLQWNEFPKVSLDGGNSFLHVGKIRGEEARRLMDELCSKSALLDKDAVEAINVADEICQGEFEGDEDSPELPSMWWKAFVSIYGKDFVMPPSPSA
jgi:hypothetical protein